MSTFNSFTSHFEIPINNKFGNGDMDYQMFDFILKCLVDLSMNLLCFQNIISLSLNKL